MVFVMAGGGTGGHVIPSLAVARELQAKGHGVFFIGTKQGYEGRLVPESGFRIEWIEIGGLMRVGWKKTGKTLVQLPLSVLRCTKLLRGVAGVFSMGGYVAAPVMLAAWMGGVPMVIMEPNAMPGETNRRFGKLARKVLVSFDEAAGHFPNDRVEIANLYHLTALSADLGSGDDTFKSEGFVVKGNAAFITILSGKVLTSLVIRPLRNIMASRPVTRTRPCADKSRRPAPSPRTAAYSLAASL